MNFTLRAALAILGGLAVIAIASCGSKSSPPLSGNDDMTFGGSGSAGDDSGGSFGSGANGAGVTDCSALKRPCATCQDFPAAPIVDAMPDDGSPATPQDAASHFSDPGLASPGPCVTEPSDGTLIPQNWLRPRFAYKPADGHQTLFEIRLHTPRQQNDLLVYTTSKTWKMPKATWDALRASTWDEDITLTVRSVDPTSAGAKPAGTQGKFRIAPAGAGG
ncbi:MAG TPA: hypothetical protein VH044_07525, partial [Polyangiaceae bacterium]|nr:hypothetical protein [Polyangiaceae bacterium]